MIYCLLVVLSCTASHLTWAGCFIGLTHSQQWCSRGHTQVTYTPYACYNGVPYSCVKLVILCCNWCIITSVILPFPAHHRLSARVRCIERTPLKAAFVFHLRAWRAGHREHRDIPGGSVTEARKSSPTLGTVFKPFYSELQKANTPKVWIGAMQCSRAQCKVINSAKLLHPFRCDTELLL